MYFITKMKKYVHFEVVKSGCFTWIATKIVIGTTLDRGRAG
jgi:hypothetical protein